MYMPLYKGEPMSNKEPYGDATLLVDGKQAFPAILEAIGRAE
jgi:hypothetical protein